MIYQSLVASLLMLASVPWALAQEVEPSQEDPGVQKEESPDVKAVRAAIQSYVDAFNKHDAKALASHWSESGEFITPGGKLIVGRADLEKEFSAYFAETKDAKLEIGEPALQLLSPAVIVEHGSALVVATDRDPLETDYEAIHVKTSEGWRMDSVREKEYVRPQSHYEQLQDLGWMIGEWVDADENATVETVCRWTKNNNFITRSFKLYVEDQVDLEGTQVIGWDPSSNTVRSWVFDSAGGFGVGAWSRSGNEWTVRALRVLPDGRRGSSTSVMEYVDENTFTIRTVGREIDGEILPNVGPIKVVRK